MIRAIHIILSLLFCFTCDIAIANNQIEKSVLKTLIYYGGGKKLKSSDVDKLAKYDMLLLDRYRYNEIKQGTWGAIRKLNPNIKIFLYQVGPEVAEKHDEYKTLYLNDIGRYKISRGHSMGSVFNHQEFFLKNRYKQNIRLSTGNEYFLLDFGNEKFQDYWVEATINDIFNQPWTADGVNVDNCLTYSESFVKSILGLKAHKYNNAKEWDTHMNDYIDTITKGMHTVDQKVLVNRGNTRTKLGVEAWLGLDDVENPPDVVYEEGAFAVNWGRGDVQFFSENEWLRQVELPSKIKHSDVLYQSHTDLNIGETGIDNWGNKVSFNQILQYSLASYFLAIPGGPNDYYFAFDADRVKGDYRNIWWFDEYNYNPGEPIGVINKISNSGINIYWREFDDGYVYVNPTSEDATIKYPVGAALFYPNNTDNVKNITTDKDISIRSHHAVFFKKITIR